MNKAIVPDISSGEARNDFADIEAWRNFAQRITKNPFVKNFLFDRDGNKCAWCKGQFLKKPIVHHTTYEHSCSYNVTKRIPAPTLNNPIKTRVIPDCAACRAKNEDRFLTCMNKLVLVHRFCNKRINDKANEEIHLLK